MTPERPAPSLASYVGPLADPLLDPRLFSKTALSRCLTVAGAVPGHAAFGISGFELRLHDDPVVDLLVCASRTGGGPRWIGAMTDAVASGQPTSPWRAISALARTWETGPARDWGDNIWLEFDGAEQASGDLANLPMPSVFSDTRPAGIAPEVLAVLLAEPLTHALAAMLTEIEEALPAGSNIFQIGGMFGRSPAAIRVCVHGPGADAILLVLRRLGWTGPIREVERLLASLGERTRSICLNLDVGIASAELGDTIGIEVYVTGPQDPADALQWRPVLDYLEQMNLATPRKCAALATYPRVQASAEILDRLPEGYGLAATLLAAQRAGRFAAHIHHIKVTASDREPATAKAYLGFWHEWS